MQYTEKKEIDRDRENIQDTQCHPSALTISLVTLFKVFASFSVEALFETGLGKPQGLHLPLKLMR